jgi:VanZ family protein
VIRRLVDALAGLAVVLILVGFMFAGLWPFDPHPANRVEWSEQGDGLRFERGSVLGHPVEMTGTTDECSVEVHVTPADNEGTATIIDFYDLPTVRRFTVQQVGNAILRLAGSNEAGAETMWLEYDFQPDEPKWITIASDSEETRVYVDGELLHARPEFHALREHCSDTFVLGTAAGYDSTWRGDLVGLAVYSRRLTSAEVREHYEEGSAGHFAGVFSGSGLDALYLFKERSGDVVHNLVTGSPGLFIPESFEVPDRPFLEGPTWTRDIYEHRIDWVDLGINVAGFIPFGFFVSSLCFSIRDSRRAVIAAVACGFLVSLTIETLQWYLPTRTSSLVDVGTNTFGAALGTLVYAGLGRAGTRRARPRPVRVVTDRSGAV